MNSITVTLKNYRCFSDEAPLRIAFGRGYTALVGPNNSGKSSFLKFFYEMRNVLGNVLGQPTHLLGDARIGGGFMGVADHDEVPFRYNDRLTSFDVEFADPATRGVNNRPAISRILANATRDSPSTWTFQAFVARRKLEFDLKSCSLSGTEVTVPNQGTFDLSLAIQTIQKLRDILYVPPFRNAVTIRSRPRR